MGTTLAISPDKQRLIVNNRLLDINTGKQVGVIEGRGGMNVYAPDGKMIASGGGNLALISAADLKTLKTFPVSSGKIAWSPDGKRLAAFHDVVRIWSVPELRPTASVVLLRNDNGMAISAEGHFRGTPQKAVEREIVYLVQTENGQETLTPAEFAAKYHWPNEPDKVRLSAD